jgi:hypothetical protein
VISISYFAATATIRATSGGPSGSGGKVSVRAGTLISLKKFSVPAGVKRMRVSAVAVSTAKECCRPRPTKTTVRSHRRTVMTQKVIEVVGTSKESFAKAAENAVAEAAKTVRGLRWARVRN